MELAFDPGGGGGGRVNARPPRRLVTHQAGVGPPGAPLEPGAGKHWSLRGIYATRPPTNSIAHLVLSNSGPCLGAKFEIRVVTSNWLPKAFNLRR